MSTEVNRDPSTYRAAFQKLSGALEPSWLADLRAASFAEFERAGFPTVAQEDWKYTNVSSIAKAKFTPVIAANGTGLMRDNGLRPFIYEETRNAALVFVNGIFRRDLSSLEQLPPGLEAVELRDALGEALVQQTLERRSGQDNQNSFALLNTALFAGGLFIRIPRGAEIGTPIQLQFISEPAKGEAPPAAFPRVLIIGEANSSATIIESYRASDETASYFTNAVVDLVLADGARIRHYKVQREGAQAAHVASTRAQLGRNASYDTTTINLGGVLSRHDINVTMDHEGASCSLDGLYMVDGSQHTDTHSVIDHRQPHCTSHQLYKGILDGKSRAVFNGKVFVRHGAQQTDAQQTNKNLLLSNEAQVDTKPQLEIFADDVKCTHGAAIGQLDEDEMFYLESRGINPVLAKNMLTYGFAEEVIEKIQIDSIKRELDEAVLNRLHSEFQLEA
ncbi:MAG TPA: Fe-S cluster assembly protein SufD [Pyrinomonadaceae bacterium]|nr:Fe-S cluster assembly protein SufD [Pyrinomonadaceae bacterium]